MDLEGDGLVLFQGISRHSSLENEQKLRKILYITDGKAAEI